MNVDRRTNDAIDPAIWERHDMRMALAQRDIGKVFRILQKHGISQRRIAAMTGQSQSEISEIMSGRLVMAYDVLARLCDGLGVPRGHMGLAYDPRTAALVESSDAPSSPATASTTHEDPRQSLARLTQVTIGAAVLRPETWWQPFERATTPVPGTIELADVERLEQTTEQFREMDAEYGGGSCRDAVVAHVQAAQQMLRANRTEEVAQRLYTALADLNTVAGWASFDMGLYVPARLHFNRALEQARYAEAPSLVAKVLVCRGRVELQLGSASEALRLFQLGQIAAQESGSTLAASLLAIHEAWAYAALEETDQALGAAKRARTELAKGDGQTVPVWLRFFNAAELQSIQATTYAILPEPTPIQRATALEGLYVAVALRETSLVRSRVLDMISLVEALWVSGHGEEAQKIAKEALELGEQVRSLRVVEGLIQMQQRLETNGSAISAGEGEAG